MELQKCLFIFSKSLACLALQMETIIKKITQPKLPETKNTLTNICIEPGISCLKWFNSRVVEVLRTMIKILENVFIFYFQYYWVGFMIIFSWDLNTKWNKLSNYLGLSIAKTSSIRIAATKIWVKKVDSGVLVTFKVHLRTSILGNN